VNDNPQKLQMPDVPRYRYWGSTKPKSDLAQVTVVVTPGPVVIPHDGDESTPPPAATGSVATIRLYAPIDSWGGWWGISSEEVADVVDALPAEVTEIRLRINSPGGEVWEAMTILNMLRAHPAKVVAVVDGMAASAASVVAAGADETVMSPGTTLMIHDARCFAYGDPAFLRKTAGRLDSCSDSAASIYSDKAGGTDADWRVLMGEETWYTAKEAVAAGLADRVGVVVDAGAAATPDPEPQPDEPDDDEIPGDDNVFDLSMYRYAGRGHAPAPAAVMAAHRPPTASAGGSTPTQEGSPAVAFSDEQVTTMRQKLGVAEDADEATILAALDEALDERSDPDASTSTTPPEGMVQIPKAGWEQTQEQAKAGAKAAEQLRVNEREDFLKAHRDRYPPTNLKSWREQYDLDPAGTKEFLTKAPVIVPIDSVGYDTDNEPSDTDEMTTVTESPEYKNWRIG
jgi:ATP-dependent protease ClpP protease subunit